MGWTKVYHNRKLCDKQPQQGCHMKTDTTDRFRTNNNALHPRTKKLA